jgi:hypothetical protein
MAKTENRTAAKAYHQERMQRRRKEAHAIDVATDLEELRRLRHYLIFNKKAAFRISAIDDYVEKLTRDRRALHAPAPQHPMTVYRCDFQFPPAGPASDARLTVCVTYPTTGSLPACPKL